MTAHLTISFWYPRHSFVVFCLPASKMPCLAYTTCNRMQQPFTKTSTARKNTSLSSSKSTITPLLLHEKPLRQSSSQQHRQRTALKCQALAVTPDLVFDVATFAVLPLYTLMIAAPKWKLTRKLLNGEAFNWIATIAYAALLSVWKIAPRAISTVKLLGLHQSLVLPNLTAFATFFTSPEATTLAWVHLVLIDLFQAR